MSTLIVGLSSFWKSQARGFMNSDSL